MSTTTTDSDILPDPERWSSLSAEGVSAEHELGRALRVVAEVTALSPSALSPSLSSGALARARRSRLLAAGALLALTGGAVWAAWATRTRSHVVDARSTLSEADFSTRGADSLSSPRPWSLDQRVAAATPSPAPAPAGVAARRAPVARASEAQLLWSAFRSLRQDRDGAAALAKLDQHRRRFPGSTLRVEAELGRAEALVLLGRRQQAAQVIAGLPAEVAAGARQRLGIPR
jgi:hypothetical protein